MTSGNNNDDRTAQTDLHEVVRGFFEMANAHDFDRMTDFLHSEVVVNGGTFARDDVIAQFHGYAAAVPDLTWAVQDVVVEGDRVALRLLDSGTPVREWLGLAPTGARVSFVEVAFYTVSAGRIRAMDFLIDVDDLRQQLAA